MTAASPLVKCGIVIFVQPGGRLVSVNKFSVKLAVICGDGNKVKKQLYRHFLTLHLFLTEPSDQNFKTS